jgi:hypothetical protein
MDKVCRAIQGINLGCNDTQSKQHSGLASQLPLLHGHAGTYVCAVCVCLSHCPCSSKRCEMLMLRHPYGSNLIGCIGSCTVLLSIESGFSDTVCKAPLMPLLPWSHALLHVLLLVTREFSSPEFK